eukprot:54188_1
MAETDELFFVDSILGDNLTLDKGNYNKMVRKWLVKWDDGDITNEPKKNIEHLDIFKQYEANKRFVNKKQYSIQEMLHEAKQIHPSNKDVVFGYIRQSTDQNVPMMIKYLSLVYWNYNYDHFESAHRSIDIYHGTQAVRTSGNSYKTAFLSNKVSFGTHIWTFKLNRFASFNNIGIWNTKNKQKFHNSLTYDTCFGNNSWKWRESGTQDKRENGSVYRTRVVDDDIVEMKVDMDRLTIGYKLNGVNILGEGMVWGFKEAGTYQAAITLDNETDISLISYKNICKR